VTSSDTGLALYLTPIAWVTTQATVSQGFFRGYLLPRAGR
jgi:hypothetical protein